MSTIIRVENVSKRFVLRHKAGKSRYNSIREDLTALVTAPFRQGTASRDEKEDFYALRNVSFEVKAGDAIGLIGKNGSGKSTLLKTLSRITKPTEGRIEIHGRVGSLLEVGTGFHAELTGRENIFLYGAIMGMSRSDIRRKFDEIVAFAESERFLDTPVKHFSSGMYVRLAFAVAAHLEPDILIVDEGLAVGDMAFQRKCLSKMDDVTHREGGTVLFVSHNMDLVTKLCNKGILLTGGRVTSVGPVEDVAREYLKQANVMQTMFRAEDPKRALRYAIVDENSLMKEKLVLRLGFRFPEKPREPVFAAVIGSDGGLPITSSTTRFHPLKGDLTSLEGEVVLEFDHLPLWSERYVINLWINDGWTIIDHEDSAIIFEFISQSSPLKTQTIRELGAVHLPATWTIVGPLREWQEA